MRFLYSIFAILPLALAAPIIAPRDPNAAVIPGKYIVVLKETNRNGLVSHISSMTNILSGVSPEHTYDMDGFKGYAITVDDAKLEELKNHDEIDYIEQDSIVHTQALTTQNGATWGISRVSHNNKGFNTYVYDTSAGEGTYSYIIDTGIYTSHSDFGGRAVFGANFADDGDNNDGNGHGTHVAGTTGSSTYGIAKKTNLIAVKVLGSDGSGTNSGVISGINWASKDAQDKGRIGKAVANMSLGGSYSSAVNQAVRSATNAGLFFAVAAGNDGRDARNSSPASESSACTVAASDINDKFASFSNYGSVVDIIAPGVNILSTWNDGKTNTISGTSMATPHITGLAAYLLALEGSRSPADLCSRIASLSGKNYVTSVPRGTTNSLSYNGSGA